MMRSSITGTWREQFLTALSAPSFSSKTLCFDKWESTSVHCVLSEEATAHIENYAQS